MAVRYVYARSSMEDMEGSANLFLSYYHPGTFDYFSADSNTSLSVGLILAIKNSLLKNRRPFLHTPTIDVLTDIARLERSSSEYSDT